ncbi:uncharacterized protein [Bombus flavifrons]|uniref:uncharacterized protein n=1 Tax=Bombus flavifrons TaxID=103934 RepID=UPI003704AC04
MAEKVTKNQKLHEQSMKTAVQSQLAKIKKEEEEELWISGEELYTEGSSDEEEYEAQLRSRRKINSNQSSRASSANPSVERRGHSPVPSEIKSKSDHSMGAHKDNITENQFMLKFISQYDKTSSKDSSRTPPIESPRSDRLPTTETSMSSVTKDFSELSTTEDQIENMEISWKANKELLHNNEELFRSEWDDDINISNIAAQDECIRKEILEVENLDNVIHVMNDKVKKAIEETVLYQYENRKRLEKMLESNPSETGKLAENTRQFFYLCPKYTTLNTEIRKCNDSNILIETNNYKRQLFQNKDGINLLNLDSKDKWEFTDSTYYVENINDVIEDTSSNPYMMNAEMKEMLLKLNKRMK